MTEIFDIDRCPRLKIHNILEAGFAFIYRRNGERGEPILLGLLEEARQSLENCPDFYARL
jgi:hypothetical protein